GGPSPSSAWNSRERYFGIAERKHFTKKELSPFRAEGHDAMDVRRLRPPPRRPKRVKRLE
ncbi:MAG: hypothetical protein ABJN57_13965, partial [Hyphomicrobiales bacterium]